ncbi:hypothetical protein N7471_009923 [Penicillium samsonianum]|uniref:uncharacterized protein n=1 Tax=Penicillium samsonianum TaxID=1882272 RepID=UPI002548378C|nr:uncharacterized protein N7471_009923 [Penicillium samsonianum]KAJ6128706.1 hypothetical protein N7471_009923 [Penicillium samsonianum]
MNEFLFFIVFPMVGVPLITLAIAWIEHFVNKFRIWMFVRTTDALVKDVETYNNKVINWKKEVTELKEQVYVVGAELPVLENRLLTILRDTPTSEQAKAAHDETERLKDRIRGFRQKLVVLSKDGHSLSAMHMNQIDRLAALQQRLNQWRA